MGRAEMGEGQMIAEDYALHAVMQELQSTEMISEAKVPFGCPSAVLGLEDDKDWVIDYAPLKVTPTACRVFESLPTHRQGKGGSCHAT